MKTEPFRHLLAAVFAGLLVGSCPALADGQPNDEASGPAADARPRIIKPEPKPDKSPPTLHGLHLKLGNVELKVRGPVIIDAGPSDTDSSQPGK